MTSLGVLPQSTPWVDVARIITKDPPEWLVKGLEHFSSGTGVELTAEDHQSYEKIIREVKSATNTLLRWLPMFEQMPLGPSGIKVPDIRIALEALSRVKKD